VETDGDVVVFQHFVGGEQGFEGVGLGDVFGRPAG
jgi:hypothetical protein